MIIMTELRKKIPAPILWLVLLLIVIFVIAVIWGVLNEQNDLTSRSTQALEDAGMSDISVEFQGRDATLTKTTPAADDINKAKEIVLQQDGVRRVDVHNEKQPVSITPEALDLASFSATATANKVTLGGILPKQQDINTISDAALDAYQVVDNQLKTGNVVTTKLLGYIPDLFTRVKEWKSWNLNIEKNNVIFRGLASHPKAITTLKDNYFSNFSGVEFDAQIDPSSVALSLTGLLAGSATFETASSTLSAQARTLLDQALEILRANPDIKINVEGHTDDQGNNKSNMELSLSRSQAVINHLVKGGINADRLTAIGLGETQPIASNATNEGRRQNRRIRFAINDQGEG